MSLKYIKIVIIIAIFVISIFLFDSTLSRDDKDINISSYVAEQMLSHHQNQPVTQSQVNSVKFKPHFTKTKDTSQIQVDKVKLEKDLSEALKNIKQRNNKLKSQLPSNKQAQLDELDKELLANKSTQYSLDEGGKLSGLFPKFSQSFSNADEFVEAARNLLDLDADNQLVKQKQDCLNETHCITKYHRTARNYPVLRDNVVITLKHGNVKSVMGALTAPNIDPQVLSGSDILTRDEIEKAARGSLSQDYQIEGEPLFGVYETALTAIPAYQVIITNGNDGYDMIIHARTKAVASKVSLVHHANASGVDLNGAQYAFNARPFNNGYLMIDDRFPLNAKTILLDADKATQEELNQNSPLYYQSSNTLNGGWDPSAVSVLSHFDALVSYFDNSYDYSVILPGAQDMEIIVNANMENALAGISRLAFGRTDISNYANSRDVVAHELTHSIIRATSDLVYERQSGALNESFADLFGVLASDDGNWLIGEDIRASGIYLRNMANPADAQTSLFAPLGYPQPFHLSQYKTLPINEDKGGVHIYSGIPNRFFYLLAEGNSGNPLGRQRTGQLAFDAMVGLNANATFSDFYLKMQSVTDTEAELNAVLEAGEGVGFDLYNKTETDVDVSVRPSGENATVFLTPNFLNSSYDVNLQIFDSNNRTYESSQLYSLATGSTSQQPAVAYFGDDTQEELAVLFKEEDGSIEYIYLNSIDGFGQAEFLSSQQAALTNRISADLSLKYYATSHNASTEISDQIMLMDVTTSEAQWVQPKGSSFSEGYEGTRISQIDVIEFDPTGRFIAFDYLTETLDKEQFWSIGILDIDSGAIRYPFDKIPSYYDIGNPSFANTNSDYIVFDVYNSQTQQSYIFILNLVDGSLIFISDSQVADVDGFHLGQPSFTQNDNAIVFKVKTGPGNYDEYLYSAGLDSKYQRSNVQGYLNSVNIATSQKTVRGQVYQDELTLTAELNSFDVGEFTQAVTGQFCLTNNATHPIRLRSILEDSGLTLIDIPFHYEGGKKVCSSFLVNGEKLPPGELNLTATINHDGTSEPVLITVRGNKVADSDGDGIPNSTDTDDDNDGVLDTADAYPLISIGDLVDTDSDGAPDTCDEACVELGMVADTDDDNDGITDTADAYPLIAIGDLVDTDSDGAPDTCDEACVELGMVADTDDDNDGITDTADAYPLIAIGDLVDTDSDGAPDTCDEACVELGMVADNDDDNDGISDEYEIILGRNPEISEYLISSGDDFVCFKHDISFGVSCAQSSSVSSYGIAFIPKFEGVELLDTKFSTICVTDSSGLKCWGKNIYGEAEPPKINTKIERLSVGNEHACVISNKKVNCWGNEAYTSINNLTLVNPKEISAGAKFSCVIDDDAVKCWGTLDYEVPKLIKPFKVSVSSDFACALSSAGISCWGENELINDIPEVLASSITTGENHACVSSNNDVTCWGDIEFTQKFINPIQVSSGRNHVCILQDDGYTCIGANLNSVYQFTKDYDKDKIKNELDLFPYDPDEFKDTDSDGIGDNSDTDIDNDGIPNELDFYPNVAVGDLADLDSDGAPDECDELCLQSGMRPDYDVDGDSILNNQDGYPRISIIGFEDNDNDGIPDICNLHCLELGMKPDDSDNDGIIDGLDLFPYISISNFIDTDIDGAPDKCDETCVELGMAADIDDDNDGVLDTADAYPLIAIGDLLDTDSDGSPDTCDEACVELGMAADIDDDNDGVLDTADAYPLIAIGDLLDTDSDGSPDTCDEACVELGMADDADDDNDGFLDVIDQFPNDKSENSDIDNDGIGNNVDADDDGDGIIDINDPWPLIEQYSLDFDNDGMADEWEEKYSLNPLDENDAFSDFDFDELIALDEFNNLTDPNNVDTDYDLLSDAIELNTQRNPLIADYQVTVSENNTCMLDDFGLHCSGSVPTQPEFEFIKINSISVGPYAGCAIHDNKISCWGSFLSDVPLIISPLKVSVGQTHACAIHQPGVVCWGRDRNAHGYLDVPQLTNPSEISVSSTNSCAIADEGLVCWGRNNYGQLDIPKLSNPKLVSVGTDIICATDDNDVHCWGRNLHNIQNTPQLENPFYLSVGGFPVTACAIDDLGLVCWGSDNDGKLNFPVLNKPVAVEVGSYHACAISSEGLDCWGRYLNYKVPDILIDPDLDGYSIQNDIFPYNSREWYDSDMDGLGDNEDTDDDNDGYFDEFDAFPLDPQEWLDTDNDLVGDNADVFPNDPKEIRDTDLDGVGDNADNCLSIINLKQVDTDGDGLGDICDTDDDNDGVLDIFDVFPLLFEEQADSDNDGLGDNYEVSNGLDRNNPDFDSDGLKDGVEIEQGTDPKLADTDDDGVIDGKDKFPLISIGDLLDTDSDGAPDECDEACLALGMTADRDGIPAYTYIESESFAFATLTPTAKVIVTGSQGSNFFDVARYVNNVSLVGQTFLVSGSGNVDGFMVMPGVKYDLTNLKGSVDGIYFSGPFAEYANSILLDPSSGVMQLSRLTDIGEEIVQFIATASAADVLVFTDGAISTSAIKDAIINETPMSDLVLDNSVSALDTKPISGATVKHIVLDNNGAGVMALGPNISTLISGSSGIDQIYVPAGSAVDASNLKSGQDEIYLEGALADYSLTLDNSGNITLTRDVSVNDKNVTEQVTVASGGNVATNDLVIFADQQLQTQSLKQQYLN